MPTRNIYVADADLPLFEQAQTLAGASLSAVIAQALRRFVALESAEREGFEEVIVAVSGKMGMEKKQFLGRLLAKCRVPGNRPERIHAYQVYLTPKGNYAVHWKDVPAFWYRPDAMPHMPRWDFDRDDSYEQASWEDYTHQWTDYTYHLDIYDSLEALQERLP